SSATPRSSTGARRRNACLTDPLIIIRPCRPATAWSHPLLVRRQDATPVASWSIMTAARPLRAVSAPGGRRRMTLFDPMARYYDLDLEGHTHDIAFFENFARHAGPPVLELGVGTGRVAAQLARAGIDITGVDSSAAMLQIARERVTGASSHRVTLHLGDLREFALDTRSEMAFAALNTFGHLTTREDQIRALTTAANHLTDGGLLILDLDNVLGGRYLEQNRELVLDWARSDPETGHTVAKLVSGHLDEVEQIQHLTFIYDDTDSEGLTRRTLVAFPLRYNYPAEMELLLERCGFQVDGIYGSYDLDPFTTGSERMIFVARRWA
ncbi:MAG: class I SAM-dependent methyltransferase, partial [Chloroflexi bacterium]|nr:class I SAM-dependent methyltransferase [Chloroflexota bacterium]